MKVSRTLDCVGLFCPMPIAKTKIELDNMRSGEILEVLSDDPSFEKDIQAWCNMTGEECVAVNKEGSILKGYVKKK